MFIEKENQELLIIHRLLWSWSVVRTVDSSCVDSVEEKIQDIKKSYTCTLLD